MAEFRGGHTNERRLPAALSAHVLQQVARAFGHEDVDEGSTMAFSAEVDQILRGLVRELGLERAVRQVFAAERFDPEKPVALKFTIRDLQRKRDVGTQVGPQPRD